MDVLLEQMAESFDSRGALASATCLPDRQGSVEAYARVHATPAYGHDSPSRPENEVASHLFSVYDKPMCQYNG